MGMIEPLIEEVRHEAASTRKLLENLPEDNLGWKPHEKSMSLIHLASHIAESLGWVRETLDKDEINMEPEGYKPWIAENRAEVLAAFDKNLAEAIEHMQSQSDENLMGKWTMKVAGEAVFSMPRIAVLRFFVISHMIHHRGQLGVFLRLRDIPVPQVYGPTADYPDMAPQGV